MKYCEIHKKLTRVHKGMCIFCYRNQKFQNQLDELNRGKYLNGFELSKKGVRFIDRNFDMSKRDAIQAEYKKVCEDIYIERPHKCEACGLPTERLDFSHVIRRSRNASLVADKQNIRLHCRSCHDKWDSGNVEKMMECRDFDENINYIYEKARDLFGLLSLKADAIGVNIFKKLNFCRKEDFEYLK